MPSLNSIRKLDSRISEQDIRARGRWHRVVARIACLLCLGATFKESSWSATRTWDGGDALFTFWGSANNWNPNTAPVAGDAMVFPSGLPIGKRTSSNTIGIGTSFASILFQDVGYSVEGNIFTITEFVEMNAGTGTSTITPAITLGAASIDFRCAGSRATLTFAGNIALDGKALHTEANPGRIEFTGGVTDSGTGQIIKTGSGDVIFDQGTTVTVPGGTQVNAGRVVMNGSATHLINVAVGATLAGTGSAATATISGLLAPGGTTTPSYGTFTAGTALTMTGTSTLEIQLANPTSTSDQVTATGTVTIHSGATLSIGLPSPLRLAPGQSFTVIQKTSSGAISGAFSNAPQGGSLAVGRVTFLVNYTGGNGNDLVLTVTEVAASGLTRAWDGGGNNDMWTNPQNWHGDVAPESGDSLSFPAGAARLFPVNDFPADFPVADMTIHSGAYGFSGNRFRWIGDMFLPYTDADLVFNVPVVVAPIGFSGKGNINLSGSKKFTLESDLTGPTTSGALVVRNLATGGGGFRFTGTASLPQSIVVLANSSTTPLDWSPEAISSCGNILIYGESIHFNGLAATTTQSLLHGKLFPLIGYSFGSYPPADLTLHAGQLLHTNAMLLGAGAKIRSAPGVTSNLIVGNEISFEGNSSFTTGAGGTFNLSSSSLSAPANAVVDLDVNFITNSNFGATLGANSVCTLRSLAAFSGTGVFAVEGGGRFRVGPVTNCVLAKVTNDSTLEFTSAAAGSISLDIELGETGPSSSLGHLAGNGSCGAVLPQLPGCTVSPGNETQRYGILTCKSLTSATSALRLDVGGLVPGISHDQVRILEQINYSGGFFPSLNFVAGYAPKPTEEIVLVAHAPGVTPAGLGFTAANLFIYGQRFLVYLLGGDGNDFAILKQTVSASTTGSAAGLPPPSLQFNTGSGQWRFEQLFRGIKGITYVVETSQNLTNWSEAQRLETSAFEPGSPQVPLTTGFSVPVDLTLNPKLFFRIRPL